MATNQTSKYPKNYPPGVYTFKVIDAKLTNGKDASKPPFLKMEVALVSLNKADNSKDSKYIIPEGARKYVDVYFTEKAIERSMALLKLFGFTLGPGGTARSMAQLDKDHAAQRSLAHFPLAGKTFDGAIKLGEKGYDEVMFFTNAGGAFLSKVPSAPSAAVYNLDALWKKASGNTSQQVQAPVSQNLADPDGGAHCPEPFAPFDDYDGEF